MTAAIPERGAADQPPRHRLTQGRIESSSYQTYGTRTRARARPRPAAAGAKAKPGPPQAMAAEYAASRAARAGREAARTVGQARIVPGDRRYQSVILAEFLIAVILIAAPPMFTGGSPAAQAKGGISPYDTDDLKQLVAVGAVFFILALVSSGNHGRFAAWFGGLIVLAIGMSKGQQQVTKTLQGLGGHAGEQAGKAAGGAV